MATLFVGLRLQSRAFLFSAFAVQLLGGALFWCGCEGRVETRLRYSAPAGAVCSAHP